MSNIQTFLEQILSARYGKDVRNSIHDSIEAINNEQEEFVKDTEIKIKNGAFAGPPGIQGPQGERGEQGEKGLQGATGATGAAGPKGEKGDTGAQGPQGIQGEKGEKGEKGDTGESGVITSISGLFSLSVDNNGNLWVHTTEEVDESMFEYDEETGNLYYITED